MKEQNHIYHSLWKSIMSFSPVVIIGTIYCIECISSEGFFHPDEHFQIVEFAKWKMGESTPSSMAWELPAHIRPSLQPCLCMLMLYMCHICGLDNPFVQANVLRALSMLLSVTAMTMFYRGNKNTIRNEYRGMYLFMSFLLWFLPAINVRFSSETLSGSFLLMSLSIVLKLKDTPERSDIILGFLLGLSFALRYQVVFAYIGLMLWALFFKNYCMRKYAFILLGFAVIILACTVLDSWFYGEWVFAPYNYFKVNILDGVAASFGKMPWYSYLEMIFERPTILVGCIIIVSLVLAVTCHYRHPAVWCIVTFLIGHSMIAHKELRFIFPIVNILPLLIIWSMEKLLVNRALRISAISIFLMVNVGGLTMLAFKPAAYGKAKMMRLVTNEWHKGKCVYASSAGNPFLVAGFLEPSFYKPNEMIIHNFNYDIEQCNRSERQNRLENGVVILAEREKAEREWLMSQGAEKEKRSVPLWVERLNVFYKVYDPQWTLMMYEKKQ